MSANGYLTPVPIPNPDTAPYWEGLRHGLFQRTILPHGRQLDQHRQINTGNDFDIWLVEN